MMGTTGWMPNYYSEEEEVGTCETHRYVLLEILDRLLEHSIDAMYVESSNAQVIDLKSRNNTLIGRVVVYDNKVLGVPISDPDFSGLLLGRSSSM